MIPAPIGRFSPPLLVVSSLLASLVLTACGGSSGDGGPSGVGASLSGVPASEASELEIRQEAAANAAAALGINLNDAVSTEVAGNSVGTVVSEPDYIDDDIESFVQATLGLDDDSTQVTREGDVITIDPSETAICNEALIGRTMFSDDFERCVDLASQVTVQIEAITDDVGSIHYLFQQEPVLTIAYAPSAGSYELFLSGYQQMIVYVAALNGETIQTPDTLSGAVKLSAEVKLAEQAGESGDATQGAEPALVSLSISQPLQVVDSASNLNLSMGVSEIVGYRSNEDGTVTLTTNMQALNLMVDTQSGSTAQTSGSSTTSDPITGEQVTVSTSESTSEQTVLVTHSYSLVMASLTAQLDISPDGQSMKLSNAGLGNTPLSLMLDGQQMLSLSLGNVAMTLNPESIDFDNDLTLGITLGGVLAASVIGEEETDDASFEGSIVIPAGTSLSEQANGTTSVDTGSVSVQYSAIGIQGSQSGSLSVEAGQCLSNAPTASSEGSWHLADCNAVNQ